MSDDVITERAPYRATVATRREAAERAAEMFGVDITHPAVQLVAAAGAADRAAERARAAEVAALHWAGHYARPEGEHEPATTPRQIEAMAWSLCVADRVGLGGPGGIGGEGTTRHPAFRGLGKGRKLASDGPAWSAAILAAENQLWAAIQERGGYRRPSLAPDLDGFIEVRLVGGRDEAGEELRSDVLADGMIVAEAVGDEALWVLARLGCLATAGMRPWPDWACEAIPASWAESVLVENEMRRRREDRERPAADADASAKEVAP